MSLLDDAPPLVGNPEPSLLCRPRDVASLDAAAVALELAEAYPARGELDPHQVTFVENTLAVRADGKWAASTSGIFGPRQSVGKTEGVQVVEQYKLTQLADRIFHTAHEVPTAKESHLRLVEWFTSYDDLRKLVRRVTYGNGDQAIELRNGGIIQYKTRTTSGGRGLDGVGTTVYDEAQNAKPEHLAASAPTMAMHPNPQAIFAGSGGFATSEIAWGIRIGALLGNDPRLAYLEHTAQRVWVDGDGKVHVEDPDPGDRAAWALANPTLGRPRWPQGEEFLTAQFTRLRSDLVRFAQEHLCVWVPLPGDAEAVDAKLPADAWEASRSDRRPTMAEGEVVFAYDVHDGWATIDAATGTLSQCWVEVTGDPVTGVPDHRSGVHWLPARLVELAQRWKPRAIGLDGGNGPSLGVLAEVREAFAVAGLDPEILQPLTTGAYKSACESFFTGVRDGKVHRPRLEPDQLHTAGVFAAERTISDQWLWHRSCKVPISPLVAATVARSLLSEVNGPAEDPFFFFS